MENSPPPSITETVTETGNEKPNQNLSESLKIEQDKKIYVLNIKLTNDFITFNINKEDSLPTLYFSKKMSLTDIKNIHKAFYGLNSCNEFLDYIKVLLENKKLSIIEKDENISINLEIIYLFKTSNIEIVLNLEKINTDKAIMDIFKELSFIKEQIKKHENNLENKLSKEESIENKNKNEKEINELKEEIKNLKDENIKLVEEMRKLKEEINEIQKIKEEIKIIKEENEKKNQNNQNDIKEELELVKKNIKLELNKMTDRINPINIRLNGIYNRKILMTANDLDFIKGEIEKITSKKFKGIEKLYQATIDGGESSMFHLRCDNVPNTLTIIYSAIGRRFGGFTTETWDMSGKYKDDRKSFLFSLDKRKIYSYKCNGKAIYCHKDYGPTFGAGFTIKIGGNAINEKKLYTYEFYPDGCSYNFNQDPNALSESGKGGASYIYANEYEVFKVLFY